LIIPVIILAINTGALSSLPFSIYFASPVLLRIIFSHLPAYSHIEHWFGHCREGRPDTFWLQLHHQRRSIGKFGAFLADQYICNIHHSCQGLVCSESMVMSSHRFVDGNLMDVTRLKEIPQNPDDQPGQHPKPRTASNQDIGTSS
jgi:hypothetical protein